MRKPETSSLVTTSVRVMAPRVSVPVLSKTTVSVALARSNTSAFLNSTPSSAPRPEPTMIAVGVARPMAQGQAMINTATAFPRARPVSPVAPSQAMNTTKAMINTVGTNTLLTRSARR